jgi:hypothetical protein
MLAMRAVQGFQNRMRDRARFGEAGPSGEFEVRFSKVSTGGCGLGEENPGGDVRRLAFFAYGVGAEGAGFSTGAEEM